MKRLATAICAALAIMGAGVAPAHAAGDEATVVEALVVQAAQSGPAWWRVRKGEAVVYIFGGPMGPLPKDLKWDERWLDRRTDNAKALILPSAATVGLGDLFGLLRLRRELKENETIADILPEPYRTRFVDGAAKLGKRPQQYGKWNPVLVGSAMTRDYAGKYDLQGEYSVFQTVRRYGRRHRVETERETYKGMPILKQMVDDTGDDAKALTCLGGYLEVVETDPERYRRAARAWAKGDVAGAIDVPMGPETCRAVLVDNWVKTQIHDQVEAIARALETPGKAVAVVPLRSLVLKDGVVEQLRARGFEVVDPAKLEDEE